MSVLGVCCYCCCFYCRRWTFSSFQHTSINDCSRFVNVIFIEYDTVSHFFSPLFKCHRSLLSFMTRFHFDISCKCKAHIYLFCFFLPAVKIYDSGEKIKIRCEISWKALCAFYMIKWGWKMFRKKNLYWDFNRCAGLRGTITSSLKF